MGIYPGYGHEFSGHMKSEFSFCHSENRRENRRFGPTELLVKTTLKTGKIYLFM
jgi:hypothetical protein